MSNTNIENLELDPTGELTFSDLEVSMNSRSRSSYQSGNVILGYDENVSNQMCNFIDKLLVHYNQTLDPKDSQSYLQHCNQEWEQLVLDPIRGFIEQLYRDKVFEVEHRDILMNIVNSRTFRAIIFSFINFYSLKLNRIARENALSDFFRNVCTYFCNQDNLLELFIANNEDFVSKMIIIMKINILGWTVFQTFEQAAPQIPSNQKLFSIFQETLFAISFGIIFKKSANSFVCNLSGCGDCITIFKKIRMFWFIESKLKNIDAKRAVLNFNSKAGANMHSITQEGLIAKVDSTIRSKRFLSSCIEAYFLDVDQHFFTFSTVERDIFDGIFKTNKFNVKISNESFQQLSNFLNLHSSVHFNLQTHIDTSFSNPMKPRRLHNFNLVNCDAGQRTQRTNRLFLTMEDLHKLYGRQTPIFNLRREDPDVLRAVRQERFVNELLLPNTKQKRNIFEAKKLLDSRASNFGFSKEKINNILAKHTDMDFFSKINFNQNQNVLENQFLKDDIEAKRLRIKRAPHGFTTKFNPLKKIYEYVEKPVEGYKFFYNPRGKEFVHIINNNSEQNIEMYKAKTIETSINNGNSKTKSLGSHGAVAIGKPGYLEEKFASNLKSLSISKNPKNNVLTQVELKKIGK